MGMFDSVRCKSPLPDGYKGEEFQTKDLECNLAVYEITEDGRLLMLVAEGGEDAFDRAREIDFHGWLNFYDYNAAGEWHEYSAKFTDGRLVEIKLAPRRQ